MGRSPSITIGDARDGIRIEHVKGRGMVRLVRWTAGRVEDDGVGLEVSDFCTRLGLTTDVLGPSAHYLLVAGAERLGAGHVVCLFDSEDDARAAFVTVRRADPGGEAWAEAQSSAPGGRYAGSAGSARRRRRATQRSAQTGQGPSGRSGTTERWGESCAGNGRRTRRSGNRSPRMQIESVSHHHPATRHISESEYQLLLRAADVN